MDPHLGILKSLTIESRPLNDPGRVCFERVFARGEFASSTLLFGASSPRACESGFVSRRTRPDRNPWISLDSMNIQGMHGCPLIPWLSTDTVAYPSRSMNIQGIHGYPRISTDIHGYKWIWISMDDPWMIHRYF